MEEIRRAAIRAVSERFGLPVYGQSVPQGGKRPCFTVEMEKMEQKRLLGRRGLRRATVTVCYFRGEGKAKAADDLQAADGLYEALLLIGQEERFAAAGMRHEKTADGLRFTAVYEYHILYDAEEAGMMERLEHNGRRAVGYEESGIQQGAADAE